MRKLLLCEELLIPTIAKVIGKDLTEYGVSIVNVRGTGMRRYARIFQRKDDKRQLDIRVACVTDRDIMPDCGPEICINSEYMDKTKWPARRKWRTESDFPSKESKETRITEIKNRADGQKVITFVSDHWTFEYDLAFSGLIVYVVPFTVAPVIVVACTHCAVKTAIAANVIKHFFLISLPLFVLLRYKYKNTFINK